MPDPLIELIPTNFYYANAVEGVGVNCNIRKSLEIDFLKNLDSHQSLRCGWRGTTMTEGIR